MQHEGLQYGQGATANSHQILPFSHTAEAPQPQSGTGTTTSTLRQFRKKDNLDKHPAATDHRGSTLEDNPTHVARVAPHNHYPPRQNDYYAYSHHQYQSEFPLPCKEAAQVKYSEISEPQTLQHVDHLGLSKHKEKEFMEMCNIPQQTQMRQPYPEHVNRHQNYSYDQNIHSQYMQKETQMYPGYKPESQYLAKDMQYHQQYQMAKYAMPTQSRKYSPPANDFLSQLQRIHPSMARSIMNDQHLRETQTAAYPTMDQNRMYSQTQRYYSAPVQNPPQNYPPNYAHQNVSQSYGYPPSCSYKHTDYARSTKMNAVPRLPPINPHMECSIPARRNYHENLSMPMNYTPQPQKISPTYNHYNTPEYAQHYQYRMPPPKDYYPQPYRPEYLQGPQIPRDVPENRTATVSSSIKHYLENWAEEDTATDIPPIDNSKYSVYKENVRGREEGHAEPVYVITSADLPTCLENGISLLPENVQYVLKNNLVDNSTGMIRLIESKDQPAIVDNANNIVNLHIVEENNPDCMLSTNSAPVRNEREATEVQKVPAEQYHIVNPQVQHVDQHKPVATQPNVDLKPSEPRGPIIHANIQIKSAYGTTETPSVKHQEAVNSCVMPQQNDNGILNLATEKTAQPYAPTQVATSDLSGEKHGFGSVANTTSSGDKHGFTSVANTASVAATEKAVHPYTSTPIKPLEPVEKQELKNVSKTVPVVKETFEPASQDIHGIFKDTNEETKDIEELSHQNEDNMLHIQKIVKTMEEHLQSPNPEVSAPVSSLQSKNITTKDHVDTEIGCENRSQLEKEPNKDFCQEKIDTSKDQPETDQNYCSLKVLDVTDDPIMKSQETKKNLEEVCSKDDDNTHVVESKCNSDETNSNAKKETENSKPVEKIQMALVVPYNKHCPVAAEDEPTDFSNEKEDLQKPNIATVKPFESQAENTESSEISTAKDIDQSIEEENITEIKESTAKDIDQSIEEETSTEIKEDSTLSDDVTKNNEDISINLESNTENIEEKDDTTSCSKMEESVMPQDSTPPVSEVVNKEDIQEPETEDNSTNCEETGDNIDTTKGDQLEDEPNKLDASDPELSENTENMTCQNPVTLENTQNESEPNIPPETKIPDDESYVKATEIPADSREPSKETSSSTDLKVVSSPLNDTTVRRKRIFSVDDIINKIGMKPDENEKEHMDFAEAYSNDVFHGPPCQIGGYEQSSIDQRNRFPLSGSFMTASLVSEDNQVPEKVSSVHVEDSKPTPSIVESSSIASVDRNDVPTIQSPTKLEKNNTYMSIDSMIETKCDINVSQQFNKSEDHNESQVENKDVLILNENKLCETDNLNNEKLGHVEHITPPLNVLNLKMKTHEKEIKSSVIVMNEKAKPIYIDKTVLSEKDSKDESVLSEKTRKDEITKIEAHIIKSVEDDKTPESKIKTIQEDFHSSKTHSGTKNVQENMEIFERHSKGMHNDGERTIFNTPRRDSSIIKASHREVLTETSIGINEDDKKKTTSVIEDTSNLVLTQTTNYSEKCSVISNINSYESMMDDIPDIIHPTSNKSEAGLQIREQTVINASQSNVTRDDHGKEDVAKGFTISQDMREKQPESEDFEVFTEEAKKPQSIDDYHDTIEETAQKAMSDVLNLSLGTDDKHSDMFENMGEESITKYHEVSKGNHLNAVEENVEILIPEELNTSQHIEEGCTEKVEDSFEERLTNELNIPKHIKETHSINLEESNKETVREEFNDPQVIEQKSSEIVEDNNEETVTKKLDKQAIKKNDSEILEDYIEEKIEEEFGTVQTIKERDLEVLDNCVEVPLDETENDPKGIDANVTSELLEKTVLDERSDKLDNPRGSEEKRLPLLEDVHEPITEKLESSKKFYEKPEEKSDNHDRESFTDSINEPQEIREEHLEKFEKETLKEDATFQLDDTMTSADSDKFIIDEQSIVSDDLSKSNETDNAEENQEQNEYIETICVDNRVEDKPCKVLSEVIVEEDTAITVSHEESDNTLSEVTVSNCLVSEEIKSFENIVDTDHANEMIIPDIEKPESPVETDSQIAEVISGTEKPECLVETESQVHEVEDYSGIDVQAKEHQPEYRNVLHIEENEVLLEIGGELVEITVQQVNGKKIISVAPVSHDTTVSYPLDNALDINDNYSYVDPSASEDTPNEREHVSCRDIEESAVSDLVKSDTVPNVIQSDNDVIVDASSKTDRSNREVMSQFEVTENHILQADILFEEEIVGCISDNDIINEINEQLSDTECEITFEDKQMPRPLKVYSNTKKHRQCIKPKSVASSSLEGRSIMDVKHTSKMHSLFNKSSISTKAAKKLYVSDIHAVTPLKDKAVKRSRLLKSTNKEGSIKTKLSSEEEYRAFKPSSAKAEAFASDNIKNTIPRTRIHQTVKAKQNEGLRKNKRSRNNSLDGCSSEKPVIQNTSDKTVEKSYKLTAKEDLRKLIEVRKRKRERKMDINTSQKLPHAHKHVQPSRKTVNKDLQVKDCQVCVVKEITLENPLEDIMSDISVKKDFNKTTLTKDRRKPVKRVSFSTDIPEVFYNYVDEDPQVKSGSITVKENIIYDVQNKSETGVNTAENVNKRKLSLQEYMKKRQRSIEIEEHSNLSDGASDESKVTSSTDICSKYTGVKSAEDLENTHCCKAKTQNLPDNSQRNQTPLSDTWENSPKSASPTPSVTRHNETASLTSNSKDNQSRCIINVAEFDAKSGNSVEIKPHSFIDRSPKHNSLQGYKNEVDSKLNSLNLQIPIVKHQKQNEYIDTKYMTQLANLALSQKELGESNVLMKKFLNREKLTTEEIARVRRIISYKRLIEMIHKVRKPTNQGLEVKQEDHYQTSSQSKPDTKNSREIPKRKRKRFRNLYAEDSSDDESSDSSDRVKCIGDYSVYQKNSSGVPKLIIKRTITADLQPVVRLERSYYLDLLAKKRKYC